MLLLLLTADCCHTVSAIYSVSLWCVSDLSSLLASWRISSNDVFLQTVVPNAVAKTAPSFVQMFVRCSSNVLCNILSTPVRSEYDI